MITLFNLLISNRHWQTLALLNFFSPLNTGSEFWKFGLFFEFFKHKYYSSAGLSKHSRPLLLYREALHNISLGRILSPSAPNGFKKKTMLLPYPPSVAETTNALMRIYFLFFFSWIYNNKTAPEKNGCLNDATLAVAQWNSSFVFIVFALSMVCWREFLWM